MRGPLIAEETSSAEKGKSRNDLGVWRYLCLDFVKWEIHLSGSIQAYSDATTDATTECKTCPI